MKIGLSTWTFPRSLEAGASLESLLELSAELGAEVFQIADNSGFFSMKPCEQRRLIVQAQMLGLEVELGYCDLTPELLTPILKLAADSGIRLVRTLAQCHGKRLSYDNALGLLKTVSYELEQLDVTLAVENHDYYPSSWIRRLIETVENRRVGVCLDPVNNLGQGESFREVFAALAELTVNFHCKDYVIRRRADRQGFEVTGCACGEGLLDLSVVRRRLGGLSWIVELWTQPLGSPEKTSLEEQKRAESSLAYLKGLR